MLDREIITDKSRGDDLRHFWRLFDRRKRAKSTLFRALLAYRCNACAARHGGYVGLDAVFGGVPSMPHGLHGVYISRYASVGEGCRIYQNVTIGEVNHRAPQIGAGCLIGAGAVLVGDIRIGAGAKIGAGAVVACDVPENATVVSAPPQIITKETKENV